MISRKWMFRLGCLVMLAMAGIWAGFGPAGCGAADLPATGGRADRESLTEPVHRVAHKSNEEVDPAVAEHPLVPALDIARKCLDHINTDIADYSATLVKHERIDGKLQDQEYMFIKCRHKPFSVYLYFKAPDNLKGQECIYVEGKNDGNMLAHGVGIRKLAGTVRLKPDSMLAMQGQRYPITEIGIQNLTKRLIEVAEQDKKFGECEVKFYQNAKINKRSCTCIEVKHPVPRRNFRFHLARVYVDDDLQVPVRYEAYEWPSTPDGRPVLLEEYTYVDLKLNNGFGDIDFDSNNPSYNF